MTILAVSQPTTRSRIECLLLYALLQGIPFYSIVALTMKLIDGTEFAGERFGAAIFIAMTSVLHAVVTHGLGPKFPYFFRHSYEPLFADPTLSFAEKVSRWLAQPKTALQLLTNALLLSVLAVGIASVR